MGPNEVLAAHRLGEAFLGLLKAAQAANATQLTSEVHHFVREALSESQRGAAAARRADWLGNKLPDETKPLLVGAYEAADLLGISRRLLWNITVPRGSLPMVKIQGRTVYAVKDIEEFIESRRRGPEALPQVVETKPPNN